MGHNRNQQTWNLETLKKEVADMGIAWDDWKLLAAKHFGNAKSNEMEKALVAFHAQRLN